MRTVANRSLVMAPSYGTGLDLVPLRQQPLGEIQPLLQVRDPPLQAVHVVALLAELPWRARGAVTGVSPALPAPVPGHHAEEQEWNQPKHPAEAPHGHSSGSGRASLPGLLDIVGGFPQDLRDP